MDIAWQHESLALVRRVSRQGYTTGLATNQQQKRISDMRSTLGIQGVRFHLDEGVAALENLLPTD
jgi:hypothetical protein